MVQTLVKQVKLTLRESPINIDLPSSGDETGPSPAASDSESDLSEGSTVLRALSASTNSKRKADKWESDLVVTEEDAVCTVSKK
jgi:hypothetical protein